jgi:uncharacterized protein
MDRPLIVDDKVEEIAALCRKHRVRRLALFGSAASGNFEPGSSDIDLLVEFDPMPPIEHARAFFALAEDLERLLSISVDLVEPSAIRNPYFGESVRQFQIVLYEAA